MTINLNSEAQTKFITDEIKNICTKLPPRSPGSIGEKAGCEYLKTILESKCGCKKTKLEHFVEHPHAFYSWTRVFGVCSALTAVFALLFPLAGVILMPIAYLVILLEFGCYFHFLDPLFKKMNGTNLTAIRTCKKEVKARIFFTGHVDAVWNFRLNDSIGGDGFRLVIFSAAIGSLYQFAMCCALTGMYGPLFSFIANAKNMAFWFALGGLIFIPFEMLIFFMIDRKKVVDGANDNLTGCLISTALLKMLEENNINLNHVEVGAIIAGSEEAGLRGSTAWAKMHKEEYSDVPTYIIVLDNIRDSEWLMVNYRDLNSTVKLDKELCDEFVKAGKEVGIEVKKGKIPPLGGSTDGAAFAKAGFKTASVSALTHTLGNFYHVVYDTYENIKPQAIKECYIVAAKCLENIISKYEIQYNDTTY